MRIVIFIFLLWLTPISFAQVWNNPHHNSAAENNLYGAFSSAPKTLDPARAYSSDEMIFIAQIYEPPLQYHYLLRPFQLVPLTAINMPRVSYYDKNNSPLSENAAADLVAYTVYDIEIKPGILYQPHPAFAKNKKGKWLYHHLSRSIIEDLKSIYSLPIMGTRELTAEDYVYEIKRLAHPALHSPIFGIMSKYIVGLTEYRKQLTLAYKNLKKASQKNNWLDLRNYPLKGAKVISRYHYQIKIYGKYPPFRFWLAMPFFSPIPWEADAFYAQPGMKQKNFTFDWYPVGTGPYYLTENNPNKQMILTRNPNFRGEPYPKEGMPNDKENGFLALAGKPMPFVDQFIFTLDKEAIPRWNKFLQGYYDTSSVNNDSFEQAIYIDQSGQPQLTPAMQEKGIRLTTTVEPALFYIGFNMLDDLVGGDSEKSRKLRQAIAIAIDYEEFIAIFLNGRGIPAQGPIPPAIFGYQPGKKGMNDVVYYWDGQIKRKPLAYAKKLLAEAGYPNGINPKTGRPLILNYDATSSGSPDDKALFNWLRKQFAKLGIQLNIRATQYNRFQDKVRNGQVQIFSWGWMADYPDPENFLFLFYGANSKVKHGGENVTNFKNSEYDQLFEKMQRLPDGPERQAIINKMVKILRQQSVLIWGYHPINFSLQHQWVAAGKPHAIANNTLKYRKINPQQRQQLQHQWNQPILWPLWALLGFIVILFMPLLIAYWRRERNPNVKRFKE